MAIYKRGNSWYVNFTFKGTRINRKVTDTKSGAKRIEEELKTKLRLKLLNVSDLADSAEHIWYRRYCRHVLGARAQKYMPARTN